MPAADEKSPAAAPRPSPPDALAVMRTTKYLRLMVLAIVLGVPIAAVAYGFLQLTQSVQQWTFTDLPKALGFDSAPLWWPLGPLALAGLSVGLIVRYLPGGGGESPADGFKAGAPPAAAV